MKAVITILVLAVIGTPLAFAHPFTDSTIPAQFSSVPVGTTEVIVYYSEGIELDFSTLKVIGGNGEEVDNRDTAYHEGDYSLIVTTQPLEEGVYTVTSKVLSRVDGHLVDYAFVFAVGDVTINPELVADTAPTELIFFPEAGARFPGLVGQTIVLGAVIASMFVWGLQRKDPMEQESGTFDKIFHGKFMSLVGFGLVAVFASNILMLTVQSLRLEASVFDILQTSFGTTWILRMSITVILLGIWFALEKSHHLSFRNQIPLLVLGLVLIGTTTMLSHGMASEQPPAIILDYAHNLVSSIWIGGIIFLVFALLPSLGKIKDEIGEKMTLSAIPRFSIVIVITIGIVIISGPLLLWMLESDVGKITESTYGKLIIIKILLAAGMIALGGYHQLSIQRAIRQKAIHIRKKLRRALGIEVALGVALLGIVAILTNGTLPGGEVQAEEMYMPIQGFSAIEFTENTRFDIDIFPFSSGVNTISIKASNVDGTPIEDLEQVKVKISNPQRNIAPITIAMEDIDSVYTGDVTFGFSGMWQIEVEAQKSQSANEVKTLYTLIKPRLDHLKVEIIEYDLPQKGAPLYPLFDGKGNIWISDSSAPRIWKFSVIDEQFESYTFDGQSSITLAMDNDGKIWFTDVPAGRIGYVDPNTGDSNTIEFPEILLEGQNFPLTLDVDNNNGVWVTIANKNVLARYDQEAKEFDVYKLPTEDSGPFAIAIDDAGRGWFTQQTVGQLGYIDIETREMREFSPDVPLATPETITFDTDGNLWISEHQEGGAITKYNPTLDTFERIPSPESAAFPNSVVFDRYQNAWFALHTVDQIAVHDPHRKEIMTIPVPTAESWIQFMTTDDEQNIWFVQQRPAKLATLEITEIPSLAAMERMEPKENVRYADIAAPLISLGIIATSLFFVKAVQDKRRVNSIVYE